MTGKNENPKNEYDSAANEDNLKKLIQIIETVKYGSVTVVIQEGKIVQIEKNEKVRLK